MASYSYTIGVAFTSLVGTDVDLYALQTTIAGSLPTVTYLSQAGLVVTVFFSGSLSGPQQTTLTGIINAYTFVDVSEVVVSTETPATLQNKSLETDTNFFIDPTDDTKKIGFNSSANTTGTILTLASATSVNRTITFPNITDTVTTLTATQTLTNKTLTAPTATNLLLTGVGSTTASSSTLYSNPASTAVAGSNNYFFNYLNTPTTTGTTTGSASTLYIAGAPTGTITTPYSLNVAGGKTYIGGDLQIATSPTSGYVLTSDGSGNATWQATSGFSGFASGTAGAPGAYFSSDTNTGLYLVGADQIGVSTGGVLRVDVSTTALTSTLPYLGSAGTAGAPSLSFSSDPNTGVYSAGADQIGLSTNGILRLAISTTATTLSDGQILNVGTTGTTSTLNVYGASNLRGITALTGVGSTTASSATFYSAPASTAMTGSNTYFFNYMDTPTTTGSTTGTTTTLYVNKGPTASATPYAIQTPIDATNRFSGSMIYDRRSVYRANLTNSGTASQSGTTVTGSATSFDSEDLYGLIIFSTGESGVILSVNSATSLTLSSSQTVSSTTFSIYSGLVLDTGGVMYSAKFRNTATLYGQGSTLPNEGCLYIESGAFTSTTLTGSDNYYFTYINTPATTGSTTGTASTVYIHGAPAGATNSYSLNINSGISNFGDQVYLSAGSASAPSITFTGDTNTGIYNSATDTVAISSNGADKLTVAPSLISLLTTMTAPLVYSFNLASPTLTASADNVINSLVLNTSGQNIYLLSIFGTTDGGATRHALIGFYGVSSITGATRTWWSAITTIGSNIGAPNIFSSGQTIATYNAGSSPSQVISTNGGTAFDSLEFKSLRIL